MLGGMVSLASQLYGPTDSSVLAFFRGLCWLSAFILGGGLLYLGVSRPLILLGGLAGIPSLYVALLLGAVIGLCLGMFVLPLLLGFLLSLFGLSLYS